MAEETDKHAATLNIHWQVPTRPDGHPTAHTDLVELELRAAVHQLADALAELNIAVGLEVAPIEDPDAPNVGHILIDDRRLEDWLGAEVDVDRDGAHSFSIRDETYEIVPAEFIVEAGMLAASYLLDGLGGCQSGACSRTGDAPTGCGKCCGNANGCGGRADPE
jgi:uncharacterized protein DUF2703